MSCSALTNLWGYFRADLGDIHRLIRQMWTGCLVGQKSETLFSPQKMDLTYKYHCFQRKLETIHGILLADIETGFGTAATLSPFQACVLDTHSALCFCTSRMLGYLTKLTTPPISISSTCQPQFWISPHTPKKPTAKWLIPMILAGLGSFTPRFWSSKMPGTETCHFWVFRGMVSWAIPSTLGFFFLGIFWSGISANDADGLGSLLYNLFSSHWRRIIYLSFQPSKKTNAQTIWKKSLNQAETNPCHVVFGEFLLVVERQWKAGHEVTK